MQAYDEFPANITIEAIDITGITVHLTPTFSTSQTQCYSVARGPVPDLCLPLQVSVFAVNDVGNASSVRFVRSPAGTEGKL